MSASNASERLRTFVERHVAHRAPLEISAHEASWELALTGDPEAERRSTELEKELVRIFANREDFGELVAIGDAGALPAEAARELEILLLAYGKRQTDPALLEELVALEVRAESLYASFRPELSGKKVTDNEIKEILRHSTDADRSRAAWEASKAIGPEVAPLVLDMVAKRNRAAAELGHRDYFAMDLHFQEIEEDFLFDVLGRLETLTAEPYDDMLAELFERLGRRFGVAAADIRPWHLADPFFQEAIPSGELSLGEFYANADLVEITREFFARIDFDVSDIVERSDLFPREGKNQHAFCSHVDRATDDIRCLCNVANDEHWMDTMLHEFGHAVYDQGLGRDLPWLLRRPAHTLSTEAIALLFGRLATDPDWMIRYAGADPAEIEPLRGRLAELTRMRQLLFPRWVMVMTNFERELYRNPEQNLNGLWWDLVERFQKVPRPEGRDAPDWATKLHVALAPVYYQNYLLGDLMASQLHGKLRHEVGPRYWEEAGTGKLLRESLFAHGARRPWNEALIAATGAPLDPAHYVEQFVTVSS